MQNINLLETLSKANKSFLTAKLFFQISAVWATLLLIIYLIGLLHNHALQNEMNKLNADKAKINLQFTAYLEQIKKKPNQKLIGTTPEEYSAIENATKNYSIIGFSNSLKTLSEDVPNEVWLENFTFSQNNNSVTFAGQTISEKLIPVLLTNISKDKSFAGPAFNKVTIQKSLVDKKIKFKISNF